MWAILQVAAAADWVDVGAFLLLRQVKDGNEHSHGKQPFVAFLHLDDRVTIAVENVT